MDACETRPSVHVSNETEAAAHRNTDGVSAGKTLSIISLLGHMVPNAFTPHRQSNGMNSLTWCTRPLAGARRNRAVHAEREKPSWRAAR